MKIKRIAAALLALSVITGCAGNVVTDETVTNTGTTTEAVTVEMTTTTTEIVTEAETENTEVAETTSTTERDTGWHEAGENGMPILKPEDSEKLETTAETKYPIISLDSEEENSHSAVVKEDVEHIELDGTNHFSKYTELYGTAILLINKEETIRERFEKAHPNLTFGGIATDLDVLGFFESPVDYPSDPNTSFVKGWGCNSSHIFNTITNYEDGVYQNLLIDLTNSTPETLYEYIDNDTPVMVWVTEGLAEPVLFAEYEGNKMYNPKECVVLAGYTDTAVCVWSVIEEKYVTYDRALFEQRYAEMGSMALTVVKE